MPKRHFSGKLFVQRNQLGIKCCVVVSTAHVDIIMVEAPGSRVVHENEKPILVIYNKYKMG
jgi:hypothetical protein